MTNAAIDWTADEAFAEFKRLKATIRETVSSEKNSLNEANTRLRQIDPVLFECLGWSRSQVEAERHARASGFADYVLTPRSSPAMVIEAKREGKYFEVEEREYPATSVPFSLLEQRSKTAASALRQAQSYANELGCRYTAITNGRQWIASMTFVEGTGTGERQVVVFESLNAIEKKFSRFFEMFSATNLFTSRPTEILLPTRGTPAPAKAAVILDGYPGTSKRNHLASDLKHALSLVWDDTQIRQNSQAFLQRCYVDPGDGSDTLRIADELLQKRQRNDEVLAAPQPADPRKIQFDAESLAAEQPVVLLGQVGHGKSTFISHLRHITAAELLDKSYIQIDVDFSTNPRKDGRVLDYVLDQVADQLRDSYGIDIFENGFSRRVLRKDLAEWNRQALPTTLRDLNRTEELALAEASFIQEAISRRDKYVRSALHFLRAGDGKSVAVFFDNLDRRSDRLQEDALLVAFQAAKDWSALIFVCLRPSTLRRSQARGVLDTIAPRVFTIAPPPTQVVLRKRFQYARDYSIGKLDKSAYTSSERSGGAWSASTEAGEFFEMCDQSIHKNPALADQFEAVANGNIRDVISYVRRAILSDHLDTQKIFQLLKQTGDYTLAEHETMRALLYGSCSYYNPQESLFPNIFDIQRSVATDHFSGILALAHAQSERDSNASAGFFLKSSLLDQLQADSFSFEQASHTTHKLFEAKCFQGRDLEDGFDESQSLRVTPLGTYLFRNLCRRFVYLDAVIVDTPILEESTRKDLRPAFIDRRISVRLAAARSFLRYLDRCADLLLTPSARESWNLIGEALANDLTDVEAKSEEATQKSGRSGGIKGPRIAR